MAFPNEIHDNLSIGYTYLNDVMVTNVYLLLVCLEGRFEGIPIVFRLSVILVSLFRSCAHKGGYHFLGLPPSETPLRFSSDRFSDLENPQTIRVVSASSSPTQSPNYESSLIPSIARNPRKCPVAASSSRLLRLQLIFLASIKPPLLMRMSGP